MKLRGYLLWISGLSNGIILLCLTVGYHYMLLSLDEVKVLIWITAVSGLLSFLAHYLMTRPLGKVIHGMVERTERMAEGELSGKLPLSGPYELRLLASRFNEMGLRMEESFEKLHSSEASRKELIAGVSHDLRTPLASIQAFVEALQDEVVNEPELLQKYLHTIRHETKRLSSLIDEPFLLSRLDVGDEAGCRETVHVDQWLLSVLEASELLFNEKSITVDCRLPEQLPPLCMVPEQMNRVLANLLHNAIRHSPAGGSIRIEAQLQEEGQIRVAVSDGGEGIAEEEQAKIFERFYRTDKARGRENGGAGLGLAIAKSIIERHGGRIGVISRKEKGSTFWFTIPI